MKKSAHDVLLDEIKDEIDRLHEIKSKTKREAAARELIAYIEQPADESPVSRTNHRRPAKSVRAAIAAMCTHNSSENRSDRYAWGRKLKPAERAALADLRDELHHEAHTWSLVAAVKRLVRVRAATLRALCGGL